MKWPRGACQVPFPSNALQWAKWVAPPWPDPFEGTRGTSSCFGAEAAFIAAGTLRSTLRYE